VARIHSELFSWVDAGLVPTTATATLHMARMALKDIQEPLAKGYPTMIDLFPNDSARVRECRRSTIFTFSILVREIVEKHHMNNWDTPPGVNIETKSPWRRTVPSTRELDGKSACKRSGGFVLYGGAPVSL